MAVLIVVRNSVFVLLLLHFSGCAVMGETDAEPEFNCDFEIHDYIRKPRIYEYDTLQGEMSWFVTRMVGGLQKSAGLNFFSRWKKNKTLARQVFERNGQVMNFYYLVLSGDTLTGQNYLVITRYDRTQFIPLDGRDFDRFYERGFGMTGLLAISRCMSAKGN